MIKKSELCISLARVKYDFDILSSHHEYNIYLSSIKRLTMALKNSTKKKNVYISLIFWDPANCALSLYSQATGYTISPAKR